jgi:hypothetical protein
LVHDPNGVHTWVNNPFVRLCVCTDGPVAALRLPEVPGLAHRRRCGGGRRAQAVRARDADNIDGYAQRILTRSWLNEVRRA